MAADFLQLSTVANTTRGTSMCMNYLRRLLATVGVMLLPAGTTAATAQDSTGAILRLGLEECLEQALAKVFGVVAGSIDSDSTEFQFAAQGVREGADWRALALQAQQTLDSAEVAQREGDWAGYGSALEALRRDLTALGDQATDMGFSGDRPEAEEELDGAPALE